MICFWSSLGVEFISFDSDIFWIFCFSIINVFARKNISASMSLPLIKNLDFSIDAISCLWLYSTNACVISAASFLALSTSLDCLVVNPSFFLPFVAFDFSTSFFVLEINFRLSKNLGGNLPSWINSSLNAFMIAASDFFFNKLPIIPKTSL